MRIPRIFTAITLSAVNMSISGDRVRGAARQVQSYLEGARTRATCRRIAGGEAGLSARSRIGHTG